MLASLETPLLGEDTAAAIMFSHLLMQTGEPLYSLAITCGRGLGTFRGRVPASASGPAGLWSLSHSHSPRQPGRGLHPARPGCLRDAPA